MNNSKTYWSLLEPIWALVSIYDGKDAFLSQLKTVTPKQKVLFATHWAQSEIRNGGMHQFFSNSSGVLAPEAVFGYRALGMERCANTIVEAMRFFGDEYPREREPRCRELDRYEENHPDDWDPFERLDDVFLDSINSECGGFESAATRFAYDDTAV